jgi:transcriptional regulator with XRE-family HTH domain
VGFVPTASAHYKIDINVVRQVDLFGGEEMRQLSVLQLGLLERGLSQDDLAKKIGISPANLSNVITGKKNASELCRLKLATYFQVSEKALFANGRLRKWNTRFLKEERSPKIKFDFEI